MKKLNSFTFLLVCLAASSFSPLALTASADDDKQSQWNGLWMYSDPDNRTGFRKYETDYLLIEGDRARLTRTVGQHLSVKEETFFVKGPTRCEIGQVQMLCQINENKLQLCTDDWHCSVFVKTTKSIPTAPTAITERPQNLILSVTYQIGADTITEDYPLSDILPADTSYPREPVKIPLFMHDTASAEAWVQTYWISGASSVLSSYYVEVQILQTDFDNRLKKLAAMSEPKRLTSFFTAKLSGVFVSTPFEVSFRIRSAVPSAVE